MNYAAPLTLVSLMFGCCHSHQIAASNPQIPVPHQSASAKIAELPVRYVGNDDETYSPGFFDVDARVFYRWNGVYIPEDEVPCNGPISAGAVLIPFKGLVQRSIDPPIGYAMKGDYAVPGYYDRSCQTFFQWRGVMFDPSKVSLKAFGRFLKQEDLHFEVSTIPVPPHLRGFADKLNESVPYERRH